MKFDYTDSREEALEEVQRENFGLPPKPPTDRDYSKTETGWEPYNENDKLPEPPKEISIENDMK